MRVEGVREIQVVEASGVVEAEGLCAEAEAALRLVALHLVLQQQQKLPRPAPR